MNCQACTIELTQLWNWMEFIPIPFYAFVTQCKSISIFFHNHKWNIPESFQIHKFDAQEKFFLQIQIHEMCGIGYEVYTELCRLLD